MLLSDAASESVSERPGYPAYADLGHRARDYRLGGEEGWQPKEMECVPESADLHLSNRLCYRGAWRPPWWATRSHPSWPGVFWGGVYILLPSITKQQVECWEDAVWKPIPLHGGHVMPTCIRKITIQDVLVQYHFPFQQSTAHSHLFPWRTTTLECTIGQLLMEWTPGHMRAP